MLPRLAAAAVANGGLLHEQELLVVVVETRTVETTKAQMEQPGKVIVEVTAPRITAAFQIQARPAVAVALPQ